MPGVRGRSGGRNAKTVAQHKMEGTYDPSRHSDIVNPEPPSGHPTAPKDLVGDALEEWTRMIGRLEQSKTLAVVDDAALYQYCKLFAETEAISQTRQELADTARILQENFDGQGDLSFEDALAAAQEITKLRSLEARYATQIRQGRMALRIYLVEFGMTPAARSRVKVTGSPKDEAPKTALEKLRASRPALRAVN